MLPAACLSADVAPGCHGRQTFALAHDRKRLTPTALIALRSLARAWKLTGAEGSGLVGVSETTWLRIKAGSWNRTLTQDQVMRTSAMIGIYKELHTLLADGMADRWVRRKRPASPCV
jgi:hypothetical protein